MCVWVKDRTIQWMNEIKERHSSRLLRSWLMAEYEMAAACPGGDKTWISIRASSNVCEQSHTLSGRIDERKIDGELKGNELPYVLLSYRPSSAGHQRWLCRRTGFSCQEPYQLHAEEMRALSSDKQESGHSSQNDTGLMNHQGKERNELKKMPEARSWPVRVTSIVVEHHVRSS